MTEKILIVEGMRHQNLALLEIAALAGSSLGVSLAARQQGKTEQQPTELKMTPIEVSDLPDRLSVDRSSRFFTAVGAYVGVRFNGVEQAGAVEFCVSGGWVRIGQPNLKGKITQKEAVEAPKSYGKVETYWRMTPSRQVRRQLARVGQ